MSAPLSRAASTASAVGAGLLWASVPKCPLCVAAWLAAAGVGAHYAAILAPLLRPLALTLLAVSLVLIVFGSARRGVSPRLGCGACRQTASRKFLFEFWTRGRWPSVSRRKPHRSENRRPDEAQRHF